MTQENKNAKSSDPPHLQRPPKGNPKLSNNHPNLNHRPAYLLSAIINPAACFPASQSNFHPRFLDTGSLPTMSDNTQDQQEMVSQFSDVTGVPADRAKFYLESANWTLQVRREREIEVVLFSLIYLTVCIPSWRWQVFTSKTTTIPWTMRWPLTT